MSLVVSIYTANIYSQFTVIDCVTFANIRGDGTGGAGGAIAPPAFTNLILTTIFICQIAMHEGAPVEFCIV